MANTFKIATLATGPDQDDWTDLFDLLSQAGIPVSPEWEYFEFSSYDDLDDGSRKGQGLPRATWHWNALKPEARQALKNYCPSGLSSDVYIMTPINDLSTDEKFWGAFQAKMIWPSGSEDKDAGEVTLGLTIEFRFMESIGEYL